MTNQGFELTSSRLGRHLPILGIFLFALSLYSFRLGHQSYWDDEIATITVCQAPLPERLIAIAILDVSPPLYYLLIGLWMTLSDSEVWTRALGVVLGLLTVGLTYSIGRKTLSEKAALIGALLLAILPLAVYCAQEVRPYMLLTFFSCLTVWLLLGCLDRKGGAGFIGLCLSGAGMLYSHYYGLFILAGLFAWCLYRYFFRDTAARPTIIRCGLALSGSLILWLPWTIALMMQLKGGQSWRPQPGTPEILDRLLIAFTSSHTPRLLPDLIPLIEGTRLELTILALPFLALLLIGLVSSPKFKKAPAKQPTEQNKNADLLFFWLFIPLVLVLLASKATPLFNERACLAFFVPAALIVGSGAALLDKYYRPLAVTALIWLMAVSALSLNLYYFDPGYEKQNWREVADRIAGEYQPGDVALFHSESRQLGLAYYSDDRFPVRHVFKWVRSVPLTAEEKAAKIEQTADQLARQYRRVWYVNYHGVGFDREGLLEKRLSQLFRPLGTKSYYEGVYSFRITLLEKRPDNLPLQ